VKFGVIVVELHKFVRHHAWRRWSSASFIYQRRLLFRPIWKKTSERSQAARWLYFKELANG